MITRFEKEMMGETLEEHYEGPKCEECGEDREKCLDIYDPEFDGTSLLHEGQINCLTCGHTTRF